MSNDLDNQLTTDLMIFNQNYPSSNFKKLNGHLPKFILNQARSVFTQNFELGFDVPKTSSNN
jgi:hypothetical protein